MTPHPTRILLVDDHAIFSHGLASLLNAESDLEVCGVATSFREALDLLERLKPDLALLDISLRSESGLELLKSVKTMHPHVRCVILSFHSEPRYTVQALGIGAEGFIEKTEHTEDIIAAIRTVRDGTKYVGASFARLPIFRAILAHQQGRPGPRQELTDREAEIFALLGQGLDAETISRELDISTKTLETHRSHMKEKFKCQTASDLQNFALQWSLFHATDSEALT